MYSNKKIIVTNANDEQLITFGLVNLPYELFTLKHNPDKVDPGYFILLLEKFNLKNDEVVYFEHNPEAVKSAVSLGIHTYHYDVEKRDLEALRKFLDSSL
jgi:HAD superfamily hydrolase (TIGR01509 family)